MFFSFFFLNEIRAVAEPESFHRGGQAGTVAHGAGQQLIRPEPQYTYSQNN